MSDSERVIGPCENERLRAENERLRALLTAAVKADPVDAEKIVQRITERFQALEREAARLAGLAYNAGDYNYYVLEQKSADGWRRALSELARIVESAKEA